MPALCAVPYGRSFYFDIKSGYASQIISRGRKKSYISAKYKTAFVSGCVIGIMPLVFDFILTAMVFPMVIPQVGTGTFPIRGIDVMSGVFYTHPLVYVLLYLFVDFLFCGALTCLTMLSASFIKYKWINCILPFVVCMGIALLGNIICSNEPEAVNYQLSPFYFTKCVQTSYPTKLSVIVGIGLLMVIVTVVFNAVFMRKKDIM